MPAPVSVIMPTFNSAACLGQTLMPLYKGIQANVIRELIICDASDDDSVETIAEDVGAVCFKTPRGRGKQLGYGASKAKGDWFLFLHSDTQLADHWVEEAMQHIDANPDYAGYFRLAYRARGFFPSFVATWANLRSRWFDLPYGDQGLLISRELYHASGGFPDIPLMEDVHIARQLRNRLKGLNCPALTDAGRQLQHGWVKTGTANLWLLARYFAGAAPAKLAKTYYKSG